MVHFPAYSSRALCVDARVDIVTRRRGYPIRTPADRGMLAPPRGFSQLTASFFAWRLLGILRGPSFA
jgi:hypothetical protein